jgi:hypothetical protein
MLPGVEKVGLARWALLGGGSWNNFVSVNGAAPNGVLAYFLSVSPGWAEAMKIPFIGGRDFRPVDTYPGVAIVNETFAKEFFHGEDPVGKSFDMVIFQGKRIPCEVVGVVRDAVYRDIHDPIVPQAYFPFASAGAKGELQPVDQGTFVVRTRSANPLALASILRREIPRARPEFRVRNIRTQAELVEAQTIRERLLAMLALFFAAVALLLAGIGLYGVLDYSVVERRREIGIRMAIGAQAGDIARRIAFEAFAMVAVGALAGLAVGMASVRYVQTLLYQVNPTDPGMLVWPWLTILAATVLAALPAIFRAVRIDPAAMLRAE